MAVAIVILVKKPSIWFRPDNKEMKREASSINTGVLLVQLDFIRNHLPFF
jgi:hypothetical protein